MGKKYRIQLIGILIAAAILVIKTGPVISLLFVFFLCAYESEKKASFRKELKRKYETSKLLLKSYEDSEKLPIWIKFPDNENPVFFNRILQKIWYPYLSHAIEQKLKNKLNSALLNRKPGELTDLFVDTLFFGEFPPIVSAVKTYNDSELGDIYPTDRPEAKPKPSCFIDLVLNFENEKSELKLCVSYRNVSTSVTLSKLTALMEIRLKLCDFANVFPGFTRVNVSFLSNPKIDFEIAAGMVTISEIPGFHTWITRFLKTEVFSRVIFPKFGTTLLMNEDVEELRAIGGLYINGQYVRHSEGMLRVIVGTLTIHETDQANSRAEKNFYCLFSTTGNKAIYKTHLKSSGGNSFMWNQSILMNSVKVDENGVESVFLKMSLFNALKDRDVFFGMAAINVSQMVRYEGILGTGNGFKSFGLTNDNREIGKIDLSLKYLKPTAKIEKKPMERKIKNEAKAGARALTGSFKLRVSIGKCDDVKSKKNLKCFLNIENNVFETKHTKKSPGDWGETFYYQISRTTRYICVDIKEKTDKGYFKFYGQALVYLKDKSGRFIRESQAWYQLCDLKLRKGKISKAKQTVPGRVFVSFKIQMARVSHETGESDDERDTVFLKVMRPYPENEDIVLKPPDRVDVTEEEGNIE